ncbi:unnamed protein product [Rotaria magnacalcarata]|nr:unnamed protein product [Rotaria magnacalcarata]CAF2114114.1 unnamed protein product [Rotaria magnacalcarata]CAF3919396.1 unnamed protein product [Rotaria magnacalcarata]CAF3928369.1 unnamed protein product [Rotaria magnacalcarata]CAF3957019.1 unnamed protein product [Rotaria magnacalcarata]
MHTSPSEPSLHNHHGELKIDQALTVDIIMTSQPLLDFSTTTTMPSQLPSNPNTTSHGQLTLRRLARRRRRQRRRERLRQQREQQFQQEPPPDRRQRQPHQRRRWQRLQNRRQNRQQQRRRQHERRPSTPIVITRRIYRSYSDIELEYEYYYSHGFPEELDDIEPDELLETLERESMDPVGRVAQQQLKQYEQSIQQPQRLTKTPLNIAHSAQRLIQPELLQIELQRYTDHQILTLQQDLIDQEYQILATEDIENTAIFRNNYSRRDHDLIQGH